MSDPSLSPEQLAEVIAIGERFAAAWMEFRRGRAAAPPRCRDFVAGCPPQIAAELAEHLLLLDRELRRQPPGSEAPLVRAGCELLERVGQGAMGSVWKARQVRLDRTVAVKMLLAGEHASAAQLARFQAEAEALARLQHPNIVQIHDVARHDGAPVIVMEFVPGGSLADRLAGLPQPPEVAAAWVEVLARAVHAAHTAGVVHRDLKPSNVLLAGGPDSCALKITDFGLARRLDSPGGSKTGDVLGTPNYAAPEQASGRVREVGPATDVYGLGAILYECLTGRPPFRAETVAATLAQVVSDEPAPPRSLAPRLPLDLETIVLKCLGKEPAERYASALLLAEDLRRFLDGRPIEARRIGPLGRAAKWVKRNRLVAALLALAFVGVIAGAVSALVARHATGVADTEKEKADLAERQTVKAVGEKDRARIRGWLRPLEPKAGPLAAGERAAFAEVGGLSDDGLGVGFVEAGLQDPQTAAALGWRSSWVIQASVGLDRGRRDRVKGLLRRRLQEADVPPQVRLACARLAVALDARDCGAWAAEAIVAALREAKDAEASAHLAAEASAACAHLKGDEARQVADQLVAALAETTDPVVSRSLVQALEAIDGGTRSEKAGRVFEALLARRKLEPRPDLEAVAVRLSAADAAACARLLVAAMSKDMILYGQLAPVLAVVCERLPAGEAVGFLVTALGARGVMLAAPLERGLVAACQRLGAAGTAEQLLATGTDNARGLSALAEALEAVGGRLDAKKARQLAQRLLTSDNAAVLVDGRKALVVACGRLDRAEAAEVAQLLMKAADQTKKTAALCSLALALNALSEQLDADPAGRDAGAVGGRLAAALAADKNGLDVGPAAEGLAGLARRLDEKTAGEAADLLVAAWGKAFADLPRLAVALEALAGRLSREKAFSVARAFIDALVRDERPLLVASPARALAALRERLDTPTAGALADLLVSAAQKAKEPATLLALAECFDAISARSDAATAGRAWKIAGRLVARSPSENSSLARALEVVNQRLAPDRSVELARRFVTEMDATKIPTVKPLHAYRLRAVSGRLPPDTAAWVGGRLLDFMDETGSTRSFADAMEKVSEHVDPATAEKLFGRLVADLAVPPNVAFRPPPPLTPLLRKTAARLSPNRAGVLSDRLLAELTEAAQGAKPESAFGICARAEAVSALAGRLPADRAADQAREAAVALIGALATARPDAAARALEAGLRAVVARLGTAAIVEVMRRPLCAGPAQRALLEALGARCKRPFHSSWDFLDWAEANGVDLPSGERR
jgi:hypothetical protein